MNQNSIVEDTRRKLDALEQQIRAARSSRGATGELSGEMQKDWESMVETHAELCRKLDAAKDQPAEVAEGVRMSVDVLRHSFERWMTRVEGNFAKDRKAGGRT
jgi:hypothetical protein